MCQSAVLQLQALDTRTAEDLIHAAKAVGWSSLYPLLTKLANTTCDDDEDIWVPWDVKRFLHAFQGLHVVLGELMLICSKVDVLDTGQIVNHVSFYPGAAAFLIVVVAVAFVHVLSCVIACCSSLDLPIKQAMLVIHTNCLLQAPSQHGLRFASSLLCILDKQPVERCALYPAGCCPG